MENTLNINYTEAQSDGYYTLSGLNPEHINIIYTVLSYIKLGDNSGPIIQLLETLEPIVLDDEICLKLKAIKTTPDGDPIKKVKNFMLELKGM